MQLSITFPHPSNALSPNAKAPLQPRAAAGLNARKMRIKTETRHAAFVLANKALNSVPQRNMPAREVEVCWYYKGVCPDVDNVVARLKPLIDGCAQAFGINDRDIELGRVRRVHSLGTEAGTLTLTFNTELTQWTLS